jgi:hypothetical protein
MNDVLGLAGTDSDLISYPEKALDPLIAYRVSSQIMLSGILTGRKLSDFINGEKTDYVNARRVVNLGLARAGTIADTAKKLEAILRASVDPSKNK